MNYVNLSTCPVTSLPHITTILMHALFIGATRECALKNEYAVQLPGDDEPMWRTDLELEAALELQPIMVCKRQHKASKLQRTPQVLRVAA